MQGLNSTATGQGFRVAVVDSPSGSRVTSETTPGSATYAGYGIFGNIRSGTLGHGNSFAIMERGDKATASALLSASGSWASRANGAGTSTPGYTEDVPYTFVMTFTRAEGDTLDISASMTGEGLGVDGEGLSVSYNDPTPDTFTFDTFNTRPQSGNDTATNFITSLFRVELNQACVGAGIDSDPANNSVAVGQTASFNVQATGLAPKFQWQISTDSGENWNDVSGGTGGTTANYTTPAVVAEDSGNQYRVIVTVDCNSTSITSAPAVLTVTLPKTLNWVGDGIANLWDTTTENWSGEATVFQQNDNVIFDNSGSASPAVDIVGVVLPANITVTGSQDYTLGSTSGGSIGGSAGLTKSGTGKLTLSTANSFSGKTTVTGGTVSISSGGNLGASPASYTADQLTLDGGSLEVTVSGGINANRGVTLGASGGTISLPAGVNFTNSAIITGPGSLTKADEGSLFLNIANSFAGGTIVSGGTVSVGNGGALGSGTLTLAGGAVTFPGAATLANSINVTEDSTINFGNTGNSALVLNGTEFSGMAGKTLTITPTGSSTANTRVRLNNGLTNSLTFDANLVLNGTFTFATYNNEGDQVYNGTISGSGIFGRRSPLAGVAGNTILSGNNTYTGGTVIADGGIGFASSSVDLPVMSGPVGTGAISFENNPNTLKRLFAVGAARTVGNDLAFPAGENQPLTITGSEALTLSGSFDLGGGLRTLDVNNTADTTFSGTIQNGDLVKVGAGTLVLDGTANVSSVAISNGVLSGLGTVNGAVTVEENGTLSPGGTGVGILTINGDLTLNGTTLITVNKQAGTSDLIAGVATANYGGTLTVANIAGTLQAGDTFNIVNATTPVGTFASIAGSPGEGLEWQFDAVTGVLSVVGGSTESPTLNVEQSGNALTFSWTGSFKLQSQTNSLSTGLSGEWFDHPDGAASPVEIAIDPENPAVFYRLINQ